MVGSPPVPGALINAWQMLSADQPSYCCLRDRGVVWGDGRRADAKASPDPTAAKTRAMTWLLAGFQ